MLTVKTLRELLATLPPDLEILTTGAPTEAVFRFTGLEWPDVLSFEENASNPERDRDTVVLWTSKSALPAETA